MPDLHDPLMIVSDLDGSLLDHHTYSWQPALSWLNRLKQREIPLIICSSKTAAEIVPIQRQLGIENAPFISENGAFVSCGNGKLDTGNTFSRFSAVEIGRVLTHLRKHYGFKFTGFSDVTKNDVAEWTGLTPDNAALAKARQASESLIWQDDRQQFERFQRQLQDYRLELVQGGRFWHVVNRGCDKGTALRWLLAQRNAIFGGNTITIGLGDGPNDAPMLGAVDYAVVIRGYSKKAVVLNRRDTHNVYYSKAFGPSGWSEGLDHFITDACQHS